jgi:uncharacterized repeat protein (TIGR01451 family)
LAHRVALFSGNFLRNILQYTVWIAGAVQTGFQTTIQSNRQVMRLFLLLVGTLFVWLAGQHQTQAQVRYRIGLDADKVTYRVYLTSSVSYTGTDAQVSTAQITLVVPHGTGANQFKTTGQVNKRIGDDEMRFSLNSRVNAPCVDPARLPANSGYPACTSGASFTGVTVPFDYLSFGYSGTSSPILFDIPAGQEIELFSFRNSGPCLGPITLFENLTDPFRRLNSVGNNPGNQITVAGRGGNAYSGNYGAPADCRTTPPDLTATIDGPASMSAGTSAGFSISVANAGNAASSGAISVVTALPAGLTYAGSSGEGWVCASAGMPASVTCSSAVSLSVGGSSSFGLTLSAAGSLANGSSLALAGSVGGGGETNTSNNGFSKTIIIQNTQAPATVDLSATLAGPSSLASGQTGAYVLTINNGGSGTTTGLTSTTTTLPAGLSLSGFSGTGWSCTALTPVDGTTPVVCTNGATVAAQGSFAALTLNVVATNGAASDQTVTVTGSVRTAGDINQANNAYSAITTIMSAAARPDLRISIDGPASIPAGSGSVYSLTAINIGTGSTTGPVTLTATLPAGLTLTGTAGAGWTCTPTVQPNQTTFLSCTYADILLPNAAAPVLKLTVTPGASLTGTTISLPAGGTTPGDMNPANNTATATSNVVSPSSGQQANLSTTVTVVNRQPAPGGAVTASIVVTNGGPAAAANVLLRVSLPAGAPVVSTSMTGGMFDPATGQWMAGTLTPGQSVTLTVVLTANVSGISYITSEVIASSLPDPNSLPDNGIENEDDFARNCFTVPAVLCAGDMYVASVPASASMVQWFRDGTPIQGATGLSLTVTQGGTYTVQTTGQKCPAEGCCPLIVTVEPLATLSLARSLTACDRYDLRTALVLANGQPAPASTLTYYRTENDAFMATNPTQPVVLASGTYWVRYQSANGCFQTLALPVTITPCCKPDICVPVVITRTTRKR